MLRLNQVAERLNTSLSNVYALKDSGMLPVIATGAGGKGYRVSETDLAAFIEQARKGRRMPAWSEKTKPMKLKHLK